MGEFVRGELPKVHDVLRTVWKIAGNKLLGHRSGATWDHMGPHFMSATCVLDSCLIGTAQR